MSWFGMLSMGGFCVAVVAAAVLRNRVFASFVGVLAGIHSLIAVALAPSFGVALPAVAVLHVAVYLNFVFLARPRMRGLGFRLLVSWPAAFFMGGTLLALPWAVVAAFGIAPVGFFVPYVLALVGVFQSLGGRLGGKEEIDLLIGDTATRTLTPHPRGAPREARPLKLVQITDPHLGPFMSVDRLRRISEDAVAQAPDLVLLTGDFLTMESQRDPELLRRAFEPLQALPGRVFACHGNHDHEAPQIVAEALAHNGIELLIDASREVETDAGTVQVVGMDFVWRERAAHHAKVCAAHPRKVGMTRLVLLHDPGAFAHLPEGEADLVLAGHTHGGQVGLLSLGLSWTFLRLFGIRIPDHGFWARGRDRMYVHRGTGHYGFPLRLGVPSEESLLRVHRA
jgi:predicted MPP superfamily phosphohydrolase